MHVLLQIICLSILVATLVASSKSDHTVEGNPQMSSQCSNWTKSFKLTWNAIKLGNLHTQALCHHNILKLNHWYNIFMLIIMINDSASLISGTIMIKMISLVTYPVGSTPPLANANESPSPTGGDNHHHPLYLLLSSWTLCTFWTISRLNF